MLLNWETLQSCVANCDKCALSKERTLPVLGEGNLKADILFVGEGPGRDEDAQGRPFVGQAGKLLDKMLASIGLERAEVYISNIIKCRPPKNRTPLPEEANMCLPYLRAQTALLKPKIIVCLGATAAMYIYDPNVKITRDRGIWKEKRGVLIMPTYHPAALLRDSKRKVEAWADMKSLQEKLLTLNADSSECIENQKLATEMKRGDN